MNAPFELFPLQQKALAMLRQSLRTGHKMVKWEPPPEARNIIIFGDRDESFAGQNAAFALAYRLRTHDLNVEVRIPNPEDGSDWNDVLTARRVAA